MNDKQDSIGVVYRKINQDSMTMPKLIPSHSFGVSDDRNVKTIGEISKLLEGLVHNGPNVGPLSNRNISYDSDRDDSGYNVAGNCPPASQINPVTLKEDPGELEIPRTQRINKNGDPIGEKCTCHHHSVIAAK